LLRRFKILVDYIFHLITPGIDSLCSYFYVKEKFGSKITSMIPVHIVISPSYGEIEKRKLLAIKDLKDEVKFIETNSFIKEDKDGFVKSRNLLLATILDSSGIIGDKVPADILFGFNKDDRVYDSSVEYCQKVSNVLSDNVRVRSLVRHMSKLQLAKWFLNESSYLDLEKRKVFLKETYSCYSGHDEECLKCNACFRKSVVLHNLGIESRLVKDVDFLNKRLEILKDDSVSKTRKNEILSYLNFLNESVEIMENQNTSTLKYSDVIKPYLGVLDFGN
jgi:7-cyano-7-deazaguanine synthase in queuosine biosynthesis